jgi:hypothetical protein
MHFVFYNVHFDRHLNNGNCNKSHYDDHRYHDDHSDLDKHGIIHNKHNPTVPRWLFPKRNVRAVRLPCWQSRHSLRIQ